MNMTHSMSRRWHVARTLAGRAMQIFIVYPAALVMGLVAILAITGQAPVERSLTALVKAAEVHVRPASAGHLVVYECPTDTTVTDRLSPPEPAIVCDSPVAREVPTELAVESIMRVMGYGYVLLVFLVSMAMVMTMGHRFWSLPPSSTRDEGGAT